MEVLEKVAVEVGIDLLRKLIVLTHTQSDVRACLGLPVIRSHRACQDKWTRGGRVPDIRGHLGA